uniref:Protein FAM33A n=1 Tax=Strix occidentalis caurina TaxID=311401 RepID=A0A8D0FCB4_STROC
FSAETNKTPLISWYSEENPIALLEEISVVKSRYKMLCKQLEKIYIEQRESMKAIRAALGNTVKVVQVLQQHVDVEKLMPLCTAVSQFYTDIF